MPVRDETPTSCALSEVLGMGNGHSVKEEDLRREVKGHFQSNKVTSVVNPTNLPVK